MFNTKVNATINLISLISKIDAYASEKIIRGDNVFLYVRLNKHLHRWGKVLFLEFYEGEIITNNLIHNTWNRDPQKAEIEAIEAASYFLNKDNNFNDAVCVEITY